MNVFRINPTIPYSTGIALVAANTLTEAINHYCSFEDTEYKYDYYNCVCILIVGLTFDTDKPTIIFDCIIEY